MRTGISAPGSTAPDRKSTRLNSSHTEIYTLSLHDALPICYVIFPVRLSFNPGPKENIVVESDEDGHFSARINGARSEEHTSELQSHRDLHSFPTRRSSDLLRDLPGAAVLQSGPQGEHRRRVR